MQGKKSISREQALQKLRHYCGYQERCHQEVKEKLYQLGIKKADQDEILATLIQEEYLNELRFAIAFAGGKFRVKGWGKDRIKQALHEKRVSEYCIQKALKEIDTADYEKALQRAFEKKWASLTGEPNKMIKLRKTRDYLLQKGFEWDQVARVLKTT